MSIYTHKNIHTLPACHHTYILLIQYLETTHLNKLYRCLYFQSLPLLCPLTSLQLTISIFAYVPQIQLNRTQLRFSYRKVLDKGHSTRDETTHIHHRSLHSPQRAASIVRRVHKGITHFAKRVCATEETYRDKETMTNDQKKLPIKLAEVAVQRFNSPATGVPHQVGLLAGHRANVERCVAQSDWEKIRREQINAARVVKQLKSMLVEMEQLRARIRDEDVTKYDALVRPGRERALAEINAYLREFFLNICT